MDDRCLLFEQDGARGLSRLVLSQFESICIQTRSNARARSSRKIETKVSALFDDDGAGHRRVDLAEVAICAGVVERELIRVARIRQISREDSIGLTGTILGDTGDSLFLWVPGRHRVRDALVLIGPRHGRSGVDLALGGFESDRIERDAC